MPAAKDVTAKELAQMCETDPRTLRKFLREQYRSTERDEELPGQGGRYAFTKGQANMLKKAFIASAGKAAAKKAASAKAPKQAEVIEDVEDEDLEFEDLEEPTLEDLDDEDEDEVEDDEVVEDDDEVVEVEG